MHGYLFQNSFIHIYRNTNDEIAKLSLIQVSRIISTIWRNFSASDFLHK